MILFIFPVDLEGNWASSSRAFASSLRLVFSKLLTGIEIRKGIRGEQ